MNHKYQEIFVMWWNIAQVTLDKKQDSSSSFGLLCACE